MSKDGAGGRAMEAALALESWLSLSSNGFTDSLCCQSDAASVVILINSCRHCRNCNHLFVSCCQLMPVTSAIVSLMSCIVKLINNYKCDQLLSLSFSGKRKPWIRALPGSLEWAEVEPLAEEGSDLWTPPERCAELLQWRAQCPSQSPRPFAVPWTNFKK